MSPTPALPLARLPEVHLSRGLQVTRSSRSNRDPNNGCAWTLSDAHKQSGPEEAYTYLDSPHPGAASARLPEG